MEEQKEEPDRMGTSVATIVDQPTSRRRLFTKLLSLAALGGITGLLMGEQIPKGTAGTGGDVWFDNGSGGLAESDQLNWYNGALYVKGAIAQYIQPPPQTGGCLYTWNLTGGAGETDFVNLVGAGWQGGFRFYCGSKLLTKITDRGLSISGFADKTIGGAFWGTFSDRRWKDEASIEPFTLGLDWLKSLPRPVRFRYAKDNGIGADPETENVNFIAQDLLDGVHDQLVYSTTEKIKSTDKEPSEAYGVNMNDMQFAMVNAIKELSERLDAIERKLR